MEGNLVMSQKEIQRLGILEKVKEEKIKITEAAGYMFVGYRQAKRIWKKFKKIGAKGLIHGNRGKPSNRAIKKEKKEEIIKIYKEQYFDCGPLLASEKLEERHKIEINSETLRLLLKKEGIWSRHRQRRQHRRYRERRHHFGELLQIDGSTHRWFPGIKRDYCLLSIVDDATGITISRFDNEETTDLAMRTLWEWIRLYGIPRAIYADQKNVYLLDKKTIEEKKLKGEETLTQFGRACKKLGIKIIRAYSPQAKGRVERKNGLHQDRLVKELRIKNINEIEEGNKFLKEYYLKNINEKFSKEPYSAIDFHAELPSGLDLQTVFCYEEKRSVNNDWTIRQNNKIYQIIKQNDILPAPKDKVTVSKWLDGSIHIIYKDKELKYKEIKSRHEIIKKSYIQSRNHLWRRSKIEYLQEDQR